MITITQAIASLRPNIEWTMNDNDVENIVWHTKGVEPLTRAEVDAEIIRLEQVKADEEAARVAAKASAIAKLEALGLTLDEVKVAFGLEAE